MRILTDILSDLKAATAAKEPDRVEICLREAFDLGLDPAMVPLLIELLNISWHFRHEDIVSALQQLKHPQSIDALYKAALTTYEYLDYDDSFSLARKCTWALADIGTVEAKEALISLSQTANAVI